MDEDLAEVEELGLDFSVADLDPEELDETITKDDVDLEGTGSGKVFIESEEEEDAG